MISGMLAAAMTPLAIRKYILLTAIQMSRDCRHHVEILNLVLAIRHDVGGLSLEGEARSAASLSTQALDGFPLAVLSRREMKSW
jgi:hypothetical protein